MYVLLLEVSNWEYLYNLGVRGLISRFAKFSSFGQFALPKISLNVVGAQKMLKKNKVVLSEKSW